jgi:hypothetical protein
MIHIPLTEVKNVIPADWFAESTAAKSACAAARDRGDHIEKNSEIWRKLKPHLAGVLNQKCWYCESRNVRADNAVDHYRPKNRVAEAPTHGGYWWRAYDWENYRFSCQYCNSRRIDKQHETDGGKHDHFPLFDEGRRANQESDEENEQPLLLDPCSKGDSEFLWFDENGMPQPNPNICGDATTYPSKQVEQSIHLYHLDHYLLVEGRVGIYRAVQQKLDQADRMLIKIHRGDMTAKTSFSTLIDELKAMSQRSEPYSATVKCALMSMRASSPASNAVL